jgi:hypothetical protein
VRALWFPQQGQRDSSSDDSTKPYDNNHKTDLNSDSSSFTDGDTEGGLPELPSLSGGDSEAPLDNSYFDWLSDIEEPLDNNNSIPDLQDVSNSDSNVDGPCAGCSCKPHTPPRCTHSSSATCPDTQDISNLSKFLNSILTPSSRIAKNSCGCQLLKRSKCQWATSPLYRECLRGVGFYSLHT